MSATATAVTPLVEELIPCPDPWDVARKLAHLPHLLFLDSSQGGRYSYVMADPHAQFSESGLNPSYKNSDLFSVFSHAHYPAVAHRSTIEGLPPFQGGYAGLFGYD